MHSDMMPQFNMCRISRYTIGNNSNLKHNTTKSMVGPLPLAPHHDYLQYLYHVYLMQTRSKQGCYTLMNGYENNMPTMCIIYHLMKILTMNTNKEDFYYVHYL